MRSKRLALPFSINRVSWLYAVILVIILEKIIQHIVVTAAFYFNWTDIASEVVVSPKVLMFSGGIVDLLFMVALWGMLKKQTWAISLTIGLALFDIVGEFAAQGKIMIVTTVSVIAATLLLISALTFRHQILLFQKKA